MIKLTRVKPVEINTWEGSPWLRIFLGDFWRMWWWRGWLARSTGAGDDPPRVTHSLKHNMANTHTQNDAQLTQTKNSMHNRKWTMTLCYIQTCLIPRQSKLTTRQFKGWAISPAVVFFEHFFLEHFFFFRTFFFWTIFLLPLVKNGKIGNTSCLIGNLNILGYMNML